MGPLPATSDRHFPPATELPFPAREDMSQASASSLRCPSLALVSMRSTRRARDQTHGMSGHAFQARRALRNAGQILELREKSEWFR